MQASRKSSKHAYELTLALIKPTLFASSPDMSRVLKCVLRMSSARISPLRPRQSNQGKRIRCESISPRSLRPVLMARFQICRNKRLHWSTAEAEAFYAAHKGASDMSGSSLFQCLTVSGPDRFFYPRLVQAMSEPFMALALGKENAIADWRKLIGPTHVYKAMWEHPDSLRAKYGISGAMRVRSASSSLIE